eukprot:1512124-Heterocapsa_arctica.AAC.1
MGRALRAEPEPAAEKRKDGRPKKKEEIKGQAETEDAYMDEQFGGASGSRAPREAKRPGEEGDDA